MIKVLLIGSNSYIAKSFEDYCKDNRNDLEICKVSASNSEWVKKSFNGYDVVVMLAAIVHCKEKKYMENLYTEVNCELPIAVAEKAKKSGVKQFLFFSTAAVYGSAVTRITKNTKPLPESLYGRSKYEAELQLKLLDDEEFYVAIVRPPKVYGAGCKGNFVHLNYIANHMMLFPKIRNKQSWIQIDRLCEDMIGIIESRKKGVFLPQDETYFYISEYVVQLRAQLGKRTILVPGFNWIIRSLMKRISTLKKIFGDFYYDDTCGD